MGLYLRIDINIVSIICLGVVFIIANNSLDRSDKMNRIFLNTSIAIILQLTFETLTCIINNRPETWLIPIAVILHVSLFITGALLTYLWCVFVYKWLSSEEGKPEKHRILIIPFVINFIITILSPFTGFVFSISNSNTYSRGPLFIISVVVIYFYLMYSLCIIIKNHKKIIKEENTPLVLFSIFSIIGGLGQTLFYGVLLMWSSAAFSFIIVYIFLQKRMIQLDKLTGAWTRESFGQYVLQRANHVNNWGDFGVIFIDLDGLKNINDTYGHLEGDHAIKTAVKLIRNSLRKTDIIARYGGDEFVVVLDSISMEEINVLINRINEQFESYNAMSGKEYRIEYSYGADIFNSNYRNIEHFLNHVDNLMYIRKGNKKKD